MSIRIIPLLMLDFGIKKVFYSDRDVEYDDDEGNPQLWKGVLEKLSDLSENIDLLNAASGVGTISVSMANIDGLHNIEASAPIENGDAVFMLIFEENGVEQSRATFRGKVTLPSWEGSLFSFTVKDDNIRLFKPVPYGLLTAKSFQEEITFTPSPADTVRATSLVQLLKLGANSTEDDATSLYMSFASPSATLILFADGQASSFAGMDDLFYLYDYGGISLALPPALIKFVMNDRRMLILQRWIESYSPAAPNFEAGIITISGKWYILPKDTLNHHPEVISSSGELGVTGSTAVSDDFGSSAWGVTLNLGISVEDLDIRNGDLLVILSGNADWEDADSASGSEDSGDFMLPQELGVPYIIIGASGPSVTLATGIRLSLTNVEWEIRRGYHVISKLTVQILAGYQSNYWANSYLHVVRDVDPDTGLDVEADDPSNSIGEYGLVITSSTDGELEFDNSLRKLFDQGFEGGSVDLVNNRFRNADRYSTYRLLKNPVPNEDDSINQPYPIVYGRVEKMQALWAIASVPRASAQGGRGNDFYVIAGHDIADDDPNDVEVWWGLDEFKDEDEARKSPGKTGFVANPFPKAIGEVSNPFHKIEQLEDSDGNVVTGIRLRGAEYTSPTVTYGATNDGLADVTDHSGEEFDSPFYPIRHGLGKTKLYVSFQGYKDDGIGSITGKPNMLIENPVDIIHHFILNYTNAKPEEIDVSSFERARALRKLWKFGVAITDQDGGDKIIDRLTRQCACVWYRRNGLIGIQAIELNSVAVETFISEENDIATAAFSAQGIEEVKNDIQIKYGWDYAHGRPRNLLRRNKENDFNCRSSVAKYKKEESYVVEAPDITDTVTANLLADYYVALLTTARLSVDVSFRINDTTAALVPGMVLAVQHSQGPSRTESGWHRRVCIVTETKRGVTGLSATILDLGNEVTDESRGLLTNDADQLAAADYPHR